MSQHPWNITQISVDLKNNNVSLSGHQQQSVGTAHISMSFPLHVQGNESLKDADHHAKQEAKRLLQSLITAL